MEEQRKKSAKDNDDLLHRNEELQLLNDKLEKSKRKLATELEDSILELDTLRGKVAELEKRQRNFDKLLTEEKSRSDKIAAERDAAEKEAREKETR